jgi:hypothetical protein
MPPWEHQQAVATTGKEKHEQLALATSAAQCARPTRRYSRAIHVPIEPVNCMGCWGAAMMAGPRVSSYAGFIWPQKLGRWRIGDRRRPPSFDATARTTRGPTKRGRGDRGYDLFYCRRTHSGCSEGPGRPAGPAPRRTTLMLSTQQRNTRSPWDQNRRGAKPSITSLASFRDRTRHVPSSSNRPYTVQMRFHRGTGCSGKRTSLGQLVPGPLPACNSDSSRIVELTCRKKKTSETMNGPPAASHGAAANSSS